MDERARRQEHNEALFRSINEKIEDVGAELLDSQRGARALDFVCECFDPDCLAHIPLTIAEYEAVRADGAQFVVAPSPKHVDTTIERVVDMSSSRYWVVEKTDELRALAEADDPRT